MHNKCLIIDSNRLMVGNSFYKIIKIGLDLYFFCKPIIIIIIVILSIDLAYQATKPCKTTATNNIIVLHKPNIA